MMMAYNEAAYQGQDAKYYLDQAAKIPTQLDEVYDALRQAMELASMVNIAASRICGSSGEGPSNKLNAVADGILNDLNGRARDANTAISEARESIIRINRAFGL